MTGKPGSIMDIDSGTSADYVASALRQMIADGDFLPGSHLRQDDLAMRLNTTRVPVREAFKALVAEGVLQHQRNRGHYVTKLTQIELSEICWLRNTCEKELVATMQKPRESDIEALKSTNQLLQGMVGAATATINQADRTFHEILWNLSERRLIAAEASRMWSLLQPYRSYMDYGATVMNRMCTEHSMIIDALVAGDRGQAQAAVVMHHSHIFDQIADLAAREDIDIFAA